MNDYVYAWNLRAAPEISVELRIEAQDVIRARRELVAFLEAHRGTDWTVEGIRRDRSRGPDRLGS